MNHPDGSEWSPYALLGCWPAPERYFILHVLHLAFRLPAQPLPASNMLGGLSLASCAYCTRWSSQCLLFKSSEAVTGSNSSFLSSSCKPFPSIHIHFWPQGCNKPSLYPLTLWSHDPTRYDTISIPRVSNGEDRDLHRQDSPSMGGALDSSASTTSWRAARERPWSSR